MQKEFLIISRCSKLSACRSQGVTVEALFPVSFYFNDISTDLSSSFVRRKYCFCTGAKVKGQGQCGTISDIVNAVSWEHFITALSQERISSSRWKVKISHTPRVNSSLWTHNLIYFFHTNIQLDWRMILFYLCKWKITALSSRLLSFCMLIWPPVCSRDSQCCLSCSSSFYNRTAFLFYFVQMC